MHQSRTCLTFNSGPLQAVGHRVKHEDRRGNIGDLRLQGPATESALLETESNEASCSYAKGAAQIPLELRAPAESKAKKRISKTGQSPVSLLEAVIEHVVSRGPFQIIKMQPDNEAERSVKAGS